MRKGWVVALALVLASCSGEQEPAASAEDEQFRLELCQQMSSLAETMMRARQEGVLMSTLIEKSGEGEVGEYARAVITEAYRRNRYRTEEAQQRAITDFANEVYLACFSD